TIPKVTNMSLEDYIDEYGYEPFVGNQVPFEYGIGTITDIDDGVTIELGSLEDEEFYHNNVIASIIAEDDDTITIEHYPEEGKEVYIEGGDVAIVHLEDGQYRVEYDPEGLEVDGSFSNGTIVEIGEDHLVIDRNHEMAGKTLYFKIRVMDFRKVSS
ncbi:MAG: hypothetical protein JW825_04555, partial [Candidatus Methanofastidiosa archaeon]|nr:hypothetical protein [Candidatus Methanofastidiosa archaeon]